MHFFRDFVVVVIVVGVCLKVALWLYSKIMERKYAFYLSYVTVLVILGPIAVVLLGFDVAIAEFAITLIMWGIFDLLWL